MEKTQEELTKEMDELDRPSSGTVSEDITPPAEDTELPKEAGAGSAVTVDVKTEDKGEVKTADKPADIQAGIQAEFDKLKGDFEKVKEHRDNLEKARREDRERLKTLTTEVSLLRVKNAPAADKSRAEGEGIDPDIERTVKGIVGEDIGQLEVSVRENRYQISEQRASNRYGADKVESAIKEFQGMMDSGNDNYDPEIIAAFNKSLDPVGFIYKTIRALNVDKVILDQQTEFDKKLEATRKSVAEETRKAIIDELTKKGMGIIPSLSFVNGGSPTIQNQTALRKELDEL